MSDVTPLIGERQQVCRSHNTTDLEIKCQTSCRSSTREIKFTTNFAKKHNSTDLEIERPTSPHSPKQTQDSAGFRRAEASVSESRSQCRTRPRGPTACLAPINLLRGHAITEKCRTCRETRNQYTQLYFPKKNNRHL